MKETPALLMLDDGTCFEGLALGVRGEVAGEVVFVTGMTGYQETLTDPSYHGQIVTFTAAHIGNYGATDRDAQSLLFGANGAVFHDLTPDSAYSNWRAEEGLDSRLARMNRTGIRNVDTRALTLHLREHGVRNGIISALDLDKPSLLRRARELPAMRGLDLAGRVTCASPYSFSAQEESPRTDGLKKKGYAVAVYDFGIKQAILKNLVASGLSPTVWPATTPAEAILSSAPDGVVLSNGPGDPEACGYAIKAVQSRLGPRRYNQSEPRFLRGSGQLALTRTRLPLES